MTGPALHRGHRCQARKQDQGAAAVEMALVLPLLLVLLFGIIDFGRMLNAQLTLTEAAHDASRAASVGVAPAARAERVAEGMDIEVIDGDCVDGARELTVTHDFTFVTPVGLIGGGFDGKVKLKGQGVMPCS